MSDVVLVDLNERETWALLTMVSYMQQAGYRLAPNLIEDYANNILENSTASSITPPIEINDQQARTTKVSNPTNTLTTSPNSSIPPESFLLPSKQFLQNVDSDVQIQDQEIHHKAYKPQRKVKPSFIENLIFKYPDNFYMPSATTPPVSPTPTENTVPELQTPSSIHNQSVITTSSIPTTRPATPAIVAYSNDIADPANSTSPTSSAVTSLTTSIPTPVSVETLSQEKFSTILGSNLNTSVPEIAPMRS